MADWRPELSQLPQEGAFFVAHERRQLTDYDREVVATEQLRIGASL